MQRKVSAEKLFTGEEWVEGKAIVIEDNTIEAVVARSEAGDVQYYEGCSIVPGFVDVQVYGAAGKLLSAYPEAETLQVMHDQFIKDGTVLCLPTVATNTMQVFKQCIDAIKEYWMQGGEGIWGIHLEGPWLNAEKRGAHLKECIHAPAEAEVRDILEYGKGVIKMITLAPEICASEIIDLIHSYNVIVAAGHSNATYAQATDSFSHGIKTVTHLFNAMSPLHHREPGLAGATMHHPTVTSSIVADGYHVDFAAIAIAKKVMKERLFAITDAVTETNIGPYQHYRADEKFESSGILSGSALSMHKAFQNLVFKVGIEKDEALKMCTLYPAQVLHANNRYGKIATGYSGQLVVLDEALTIKDIIS